MLIRRIEQKKSRDAADLEARKGMPVILNARSLVGKGRDGIICRLPESYSATYPRRKSGWPETWVVKVPRYLIKNLKQHYLTAVTESLVGSQAELKARLAMQANVQQETLLQNMIWKFLCTDYLRTINFPTTPWDSKLDVSKLWIHGTLLEDAKQLSIDEEVAIKDCILMPLALMDAFQALVHHYSDNLFVNFCRDVLIQLMFLEENNIVHGDFKLANILLFEGPYGNYVFVLADFWDSFICDTEGKVIDLSPESSLRRLTTWKFRTEKFGTRLYKDPSLLEILRKARPLTKSAHHNAISGINPGKVNLWSFGVVNMFVLCPKVEGEMLKRRMKSEILYSGRTTYKDPITSSEAIRRLKKLLTPAANSESGWRFMPKSRSWTDYKSQVYRSPDKSRFKDRLRQVIMEYIIAEPSSRLTTREAYNKFGLNRLPQSERNLSEDLTRCNRQDCKTCRT